MPVFAFLLVMALVAGLVAAGGDWVGHRAARRKIRIGGLRPRHASTLIAVITGVLIALVTYGVVLAVWRDAREALTSYGTVKANLAKATNELSQLQGRLSEAEQRIAEADQRVADAELEVQDLEDQGSAMRGQIVDLAMKLGEKNDELEKLQNQVAKAENDLKIKKAAADSEQFRVNGLLSLKNELGDQIEALEQQIAQMEEGEIVLRRGTYLAYQRVSAGEREQLSEIIQGALNRVNVNLARDGLSLDTEQSAERAREFISAFPYTDDSLIIISAAQNVFEGRTVLLSFEARRLVPLVQSGTAVLEVEVSGTQASVRSLGGAPVRISVPQTFDTDSLVEFSVRLENSLSEAAVQSGFLPNLRTDEIPTPVAGLAGRATELIQTPRPYVVRFIANSDMNAIDGLADCRIEIKGQPAE